MAVDDDHAGDDGGTSVLGCLAYDVRDGACEVAMIDVARQRRGNHGIPIRDEVELELLLNERAKGKVS